MDILSQEITIVLIGSAFFLLVAVGIIVLFLVYQKKQLQNLIQKQELQNQFQQELLSSRLEVQEQTLNNVSQEIHDNIGQVLSLVKLNLNRTLSGQVETGKPLLESTKELVSKAIEDLRGISKTLNTGYISNTPLSESLERDLSTVQQSGAFETKLQINGSEPGIDSQKKIVVYRMAQELLNNAIKHSKATLIQINLSFLEGKVHMQIVDNGVGIQPDLLEQKSKSGTGLGNLFHRARIIGGEFSMDSSEWEGTTATLILPL